MNSKQRKTLGIVLFIISTIFWLALFSLPLLPFKGKILITLGTVCFVIGEVLFYLSVFVLGRELYATYKTRFHPRNWFKKKVHPIKNSAESVDSDINTKETPETFLS